MVLFDIFTLPQTAFLALLSAIGVVVGLGVGGYMFINPPVLLTLMLIVYMLVSTFWTSVVDGARKEFAIQFGLLSTFLLAIHIRPESILVVLLMLYLASLLNLVYALGQSLGHDALFPMRLIMDSNDRRPIGMIGNMNFFASYVIGVFWIGVYLAIEVSPVFWCSVPLSLYLLYKTKCRGAIIGLAGSSYFLLILLSLGKWISPSWIYGLIPLGLFIVFGIFGWLWEEWENINTERLNWKEDRHADSSYMTLRYRLCYWKVGWKMFTKKIIQGHGLRSYRKLVYYVQAEINEKDPSFLDEFRYITPQPRECHNDWLEDLVELGLIGTAIRWSLIGFVFYLGIKILPGNLMVLFMLTAMTAACGHALFFFNLRLPAPGMVFWMLGGFVVSISAGATWGMTYFVPPVVVVFLGLILAWLWWEINGKNALGSYWFMRFQKTFDPMEKELFCHRALHYGPEETIYNTHMLLGYQHVSPGHALKYAEQMWHYYDGMTPGWVMHFNMGSIAEQLGYYELAQRQYSASHRLLPSFKPTANRLQFMETVVPFPAQGSIMKKVKEEVRLQILLFLQQMEGLEKDKQILVGQINTTVLEEAGRLNIPQGWHYEHEQGIFLSPEEMQQQQKMQATQQGQQKNLFTPPKEGEDG
jgi:hypothetical protein